MNREGGSPSKQWVSDSPVGRLYTYNVQLPFDDLLLTNMQVMVFVALDFLVPIGVVMFVVAVVLALMGD